MSSLFSRATELPLAGPRRSVALAAALVGLLAFAAPAIAAPTHPTSMQFSCEATAPIRIGEITNCEVTVEDLTEPPTIPKGTVEFETDGPGTFRDAQTSTPTNTCTLKTVTGGSSQCGIKYNAFDVGTGTHNLEAEYSGDASHKTSKGEASLEIVRPTATSISCAPFSSRSKSINCNVLVVDQAFPDKITPTGQAQFFSAAANETQTCTLSEFVSELGPVPGKAACAFTYTPSPKSDKKEVDPINAFYFGDAQHQSSGGESSITILGVSFTDVTCEPGPQVVLGEATSCEIVVEGPPGEVPENSVELTSDGPGGFPDGSNLCELAPIAPRVAACTVRFEPEATGSPILTARYFGDSDLEGSQTSFPLEVIRETKTALSCAPSDLSPGSQSTCTVTVEDPLAGSPAETLPTGTVALSSSNQGVFEPGPSCELSPIAAEPNAASCVVTYTPGQPVEHELVAQYEGDAQHLPSQGTFELTVHRPTTTEVSCDPAKVETGAATACTVSVSDLSPAFVHPEGRVDFSSDSPGAFEADGSCVLSDGANGNESRCQVTYTPAQIESGSHRIAAAYEGVPGTDPSEGSTTVQVVNPTATSISCQPAIVASGVSTTCTATVADEASETKPVSGTVAFGHSGAGEFSSDGTCLLNDEGEGHASCSVDYTPQATEAGTQQLTAAYEGDERHASSEGATSIKALAEKDTTVTTVECAPASVEVGTPTHCVVTATDSAAGEGGPPSGEVSFASDSPGEFSTPGPASCELGEAEGDDASCSVDYTPSEVAGGSHTITAGYGGDAAHKASAGTTPLTVTGRHDTATELHCEDSNLPTGSSTECTATVEDTADTGPTTPSGTVQFTDADQPGTFDPASCVLEATGDGVSSCADEVTLSPTLVGAHHLRAEFPGDAHHEGSTGQLTVDVSPDETSVEVVCAPNPVALNHVSFCTVTVEDTADTPIGPTGLVSFGSDGDGDFPDGDTCQVQPVFDSPGNISNSKSACLLRYVPTGPSTASRTIAASYEGDPRHAPSAGSADLAVTVEHPTEASFTCTPSRVEVGEASHCTVTVEDQLPPGQATVPEEEVSFNTDAGGTFSVEECNLSSNGDGKSASCEVDYFPGEDGNHLLTASYKGDTVHSSSQGSFVLVVGPPHETSTELECTPAIVAPGHISFCTVTVEDTADAPLTPTETVSFQASGEGEFVKGGSCTLHSSDSDGSAVCQVFYAPTGSSGARTITASYGGDPIHLGSGDSAVVQVIAEHATTAELSCTPAAVEVGQTAHCKATIEDTLPEGQATTPKGSVPFVTRNDGQFSKRECALSPNGDGRSASCEVDYVANAVDGGTHQLELGYAGDSIHGGSNDVFGLHVAGTAATLACQPTDVTVGGAAACTVTVEDTSIAGHSTPTGEVRFSSDGPGDFSSDSACELLPAGTDRARCQIVYTPSAVGPDPSHTIEASYEGDASHPKRASFAHLTVSAPAGRHPTATSLDCQPSSVILGGVSVCTANVADLSLNPSAPSGGVVFASDSGGEFSAGGCILFAVAQDKSRCQVIYKPGTAAPHQLTAIFAGDSAHEPSLNTDDLLVSPPNGGDRTETAIACQPSTLTVGEASNCTATVTDIDANSTPTGGVLFASDSAGGFGAGGCHLAKTAPGQASCELTYTPAKAGQHKIAAAYEGDAGSGGGFAHEPSPVVSTTLTANPAPVHDPPPPPSPPAVGKGNGPAPNTTLKKKPRKKTAVRRAVFRFVSDQPGASFQCKLDRKPFRPCRSPFRAKLKPGRHTFQVRAISAQGIVDPTPAAFRWKVG